MAFQCLRCHAEIDKSFKACPHCGEPVTDFRRRYADEPLDGKYRILDRLGAGGMGEVYKVEHVFLGTTRVVKVIRPQIQESREAHDRFLREARAATKVQHANVATMHDFAALPDGSHYMVWEFIDGENLAQRLRARGTLPPRQAVRIAIEALHGLEAIHRAGIIHRDVSPENLMIVHGTDAVKIIDLGVAKVDDPSEVSATRTGIFVGKMRYASPEQLGFLPEGEKLDVRADLYSLAMVLYELLTGRPPYEAKSPHEYFLLHSRETQFQPVELPRELPGGASLQSVLTRALMRDRNQRYGSAREFAQVLEEVERQLPDPAAMKTMALAFDADATIRHTPPPAAETVRTPLPSVAPPRATVHTPRPRGAAAASAAGMEPRPAAGAAAAPQAPKRSAIPFVVIALLLVFALGLGAILLTRKDDEPTTVATVTTTTTAPPSQPAQSTMDVVTEPEPVLVDTSTTTAPPPPEPTPAPIRTVTRAPEPEPVGEVEREPEPAREEPRAEEPADDDPAPPSTNIRAYVDGSGGDEDVNDALIEELRGHLAGQSRVALRAGLMQPRLAAALRSEIPQLTVVDRADVVIHFRGQFERLGRGRKRREAAAVITKNGRAIFRYQLPSEVYRVGHDPVEAFVSVFSNAF